VNILPDAGTVLVVLNVVENMKGCRLRQDFFGVLTDPMIAFSACTRTRETRRRHEAKNKNSDFRREK
jgi:hypothetical protein